MGQARHGAGERATINGLLVLGKQWLLQHVSRRSLARPTSRVAPITTQARTAPEYAHWSRGRAGSQTLGLPLLADNLIFRHTVQFWSGVCFGGKVFLKSFHRTLIFCLLESDQDLGTWTANKGRQSDVSACLSRPQQLAVFLGCLDLAFYPGTEQDLFPGHHTESYSAGHRAADNRFQLCPTNRKTPCIVLWSLT